MIFDSMKNMDTYKEFPLLYQALAYLSKLEPGMIPERTQVLEEGVLFCNPVKLTTKPESECIYEAHKKYIDVHYVVEGVEKIATADVDSLAVDTPYDEEKECLLLTGEEEGHYYLKPGKFMVCFPADAHKVGMMKDEPVQVKKIVFKIKAG